LWLGLKHLPYDDVVTCHILMYYHVLLCSHSKKNMNSKKKRCAKNEHSPLDSFIARYKIKQFSHIHLKIAIKIGKHYDKNL